MDRAGGAGAVLRRGAARHPRPGDRPGDVHRGHHGDGDPRRPGRRLGVASALPNISRYTGGALGAAILGAILNAHLPAGLEEALGRVSPAGRALVADGFRTALLAAAGFLLLAALAASRMPRLDAREPAAVAPPPPSLDAPVPR